MINPPGHYIWNANFMGSPQVMETNTPRLLDMARECLYLYELCDTCLIQECRFILIEFPDFIPSEIWPDPKYVDDWEKKGWLHVRK